MKEPNYTPFLLSVEELKQSELDFMSEGETKDPSLVIFKHLSQEDLEQAEIDLASFRQEAGSYIQEEHEYFGEAFYEGGDNE